VQNRKKNTISLQAENRDQREKGTQTIEEDPEKAGVGKRILEEKTAPLI